MGNIPLVKTVVTLAALALLASCTAVGFAPDYVVIELAPTGALRAAIKAGDARGVSVDLAHELAWRLRVPLEIVPDDAAGWDVKFFAVGPNLPEDVAPSAPFAIVDGIGQVMVTPKDRERGAKYLRAFVEEQKANGLVAAALARSGPKDAIVAPPAKD